MSGKKIYISPPCVAGDELDMVREAIESGWIAPLGPHVDAFEKEFAARVGMRRRSGPRQRNGGFASGLENSWGWPRR